MSADRPNQPAPPERSRGTIPSEAEESAIAPETIAPQTVAKVITAIGEVLGPLGRTARPDSNLRADLAMDAIHLLSLAQELDEKHGTEIADTEVESWRTVPDVARTLAAHLARQTGEVA